MGVHAAKEAHVHTDASSLSHIDVHIEPCTQQLTK